MDGLVIGRAHLIGGEVCWTGLRCVDRRKSIQSNRDRPVQGDF